MRYFVSGVCIFVCDMWCAGNGSGECVDYYPVFWSEKRVVPEGFHAKS